MIESRRGEKGVWGKKEIKEKREMENKVRELQRWTKIEEREKGKRNVVVKGLEVKEWGIKKAVGELWKEMAVQA